MGHTGGYFAAWQVSKNDMVAMILELEPLVDNIAFGGRFGLSRLGRVDPQKHQAQ